MLNVVGLGASVERGPGERAYEAVAGLSCPGMQLRTDIAAQS